MTGQTKSSAGSDAAAIEARAAALREQWLKQQRAGTRLDDHVRMDHLSRARDAAKAGAADADKDAANLLQNAKDTLKEAADFDAQAKKLEVKDPAEAQEYRELAAERRANAEEITGLARATQAEGDRYRTEADRLDKEYQSASNDGVKHMVALEDAEIQIDHLEEKAASLRQAERSLGFADQADRDAIRMRAEGNQKGADNAVARAAKHRADADAAQRAADAKHVDEAVFSAAGLSAPEPPASTASTDPPPADDGTAVQTAAVSADPSGLDEFAAQTATADATPSDATPSDATPPDATPTDTAQVAQADATPTTDTATDTAQVAQTAQTDASALGLDEQDAPPASAGTDSLSDTGQTDPQMEPAAASVDPEMTDPDPQQDPYVAPADDQTSGDTSAFDSAAATDYAGADYAATDDSAGAGYADTGDDSGEYSDA